MTKHAFDLDSYHVILFTVHRAIDIVEVLVSQGASCRGRGGEMEAWEFWRVDGRKMVFGKGVAGDKSLKLNPHCCVWGVEDGGGGILTTGHTGEAAGVIEAIQSLAGIIRPVHAFPTLHTGPCRQQWEGGKKHNGTQTRIKVES